MRRLALGCLAALALGACKGRSVDQGSRELKTAAERVAFVKAFALFPSEPSDAEFHVVFQDNSRGFLAREDDLDLKVALKVSPDDVAKWTVGCSAAALEPRFEWADALLQGRAGWDVTSKPQSLLCAKGERRLIHVKEAVVFREVKSGG